MKKFCKNLLNSIGIFIFLMEYLFNLTFTDCCCKFVSYEFLSLSIQIFDFKKFITIKMIYQVKKK